MTSDSFSRWLQGLDLNADPTQAYERESEHETGTENTEQTDPAIDAAQALVETTRDLAHQALRHLWFLQLAQERRAYRESIAAYVEALETPHGLYQDRDAFGVLLSARCAYVKALEELAWR